jgi:hypothetical protein
MPSNVCFGMELNTLVKIASVIHEMGKGRQCNL